MDFPVSSSSVSEESTLSSIASVDLESLISDPPTKKVSLMDDAEAVSNEEILAEETEGSPTAGADRPTVSVEVADAVSYEEVSAVRTEGSLTVESDTEFMEVAHTLFHEGVSAVGTEGSLLAEVDRPTESLEVAANERSSPAAVGTEGSITAKSDRPTESVEVTAMERSSPGADRQTQASSKSNNNSLTVTGSTLSGRDGRPSSRRGQPTRKSSRYSKKIPATPRGPTVSPATLDLNSCRRSARVAEKLSNERNLVGSRQLLRMQEGVQGEGSGGAGSRRQRSGGRTRTLSPRWLFWW